MSIGRLDIIERNLEAVREFLNAVKVNYVELSISHLNGDNIKEDIEALGKIIESSEAVFRSLNAECKDIEESLNQLKDTYSVLIKDDDSDENKVKILKSIMKFVKSINYYSYVRIKKISRELVGYDNELDGELNLLTIRCGGCELINLNNFDDIMHALEVVKWEVLDSIYKNIKLRVDRGELTATREQLERLARLHKEEMPY